MKTFRFPAIVGSGGSAFRRIRKDEDGTSTIEFVLWLPIFILILGVVVDTCLYFLAQSRLYDSAADATRRWAVGSMTQIEAENFAAANAGFRGTSATAAGTQAGNTVTMVVSLPSSAVAITGVLGFVTSDQMTASVTQMAE